MYLDQGATDDDERDRVRAELWRPPPGELRQQPAAERRTVTDLLALQANLAADDH